MSKFKVGDRVAVYSGSVRAVGVVENIYPKDSLKHFQTTLDKDGLICIKVSETSLMYVHPKQCRHITKRKPRKLWVSANVYDKCTNGEDSLSFTSFILSASGPKQLDDIEFIEVRKKK